MIDNKKNMSLMGTEEYIKIKELLERYYAGATTATENRLLEDFFVHADSLPSELEVERELFCGIAAAADSIEEIPEQYSKRINDALEAEISRENNIVGSRVSWSKLLLAAGSIAACLLVAFMAVKMIAPLPQTQHKEPFVAKQKEIKQPKEKESSEPIETKSIDKKHIAAKSSKPKIKRVKAYQTPAIAIETEESDEYLSEEEESRLLANNYHVVTDEREAMAIMSSVFSRMEGNVATESGRIAGHISDYEIEMDKLNN